MSTVDSVDGSLNFDILGFQLKLKSSGSGKSDPREVADLVRKEADKISSHSPNLNRGEVAILVALKMAQDRLDIEMEYRDNVERFSSTAEDALQYFECVSRSV